MNETRKRVKRTSLQPGHWWGLDKEAGVPPKRVENPSSVHILHILLHHLLTLCGLHYHQSSCWSMLNGQSNGADVRPEIHITANLSSGALGYHH